LQEEGGSPHEPAGEEDAGQLEARHEPLPPDWVSRFVFQQRHGRLRTIDVAAWGKVPSFGRAMIIPWL
jgi:hypothetical protein